MQSHDDAESVIRGRFIEWTQLNDGKEEAHGHQFYLAKVTGKKWANRFIDGELFLRNLAEFGIDNLY